MASAVAFSAKRLLLCMGLTSALVVGTAACTDDNSDTGKVVSITDGDTLVASVNGKDQTIRLLNIDTPETKDPSKPVECLGEEATAFLEEMLPIGTKIKLVYDIERTDKYDRTLAAVYTPDKAFVSAEIARAGFGTAISFGKNTKFLPPVEEAEQEAKSSGRGIYDAAEECTIPGQLAAANESLEAMAAAEAGSTSTATGSVLASAATAITTAHALQAVLKAGRAGTNLVRWAAFTDVELAAQLSSLSANVKQAESNAAAWNETQSGQEKTEAEAAARKAAAEAEEAAKKAAAEARAKEEAAAKKAAAEAEKVAAAAAQKAADAAAAEAERIRNLPPVYVPPAPPVYQPPAQDSGGGYPGYTGPRCYLPGGKTYRPC